MATSSAVWINTMDPKQSATDSMGSVLFTYAREGNKAKVQEILAKGLPLSTDTVGTTALHCAVVGDSVETCEILIKAGVNVESKTKVDRTPLHLAAYGGHYRIIQLLFEKNCQVDPLDMLQMTPLHWAVEKRHPRVVEMLLDRGANPLAVSKFRKTPMSIAEEHGDEEILAQLRAACVRTNNNLPKTVPVRSSSIPVDVQLDIIDYEGEEEGDDGSISVFGLDDNLDGDDGDVEVIPSVEGESMDVESGQEEGKDGRIVQHDMEDSNLHESINKLGNIRGLKQADATTLKILQNIGISMLPTEDPDTTLISNALQSGRNIILSEAGKYILNKTKSSNSAVPILPKTVAMTNKRPRQESSNSSSSTGKIQTSQAMNHNSSVPHSSNSLVKPSVSSIVTATLGSGGIRSSIAKRIANSSVQQGNEANSSLINRGMVRKRSTENEVIVGKSKVLLKEVRQAQQPWIQRLGMTEEGSSSGSPVQFNSSNTSARRGVFRLTDEVEIEVEEASTEEIEEEEEDNVEEEVIRVPLNRIQKMENQILSLSRENKQLRNKLELSYKLIDENRKRIERLEEADPEKKKKGVYRM